VKQFRKSFRNITRSIAALSTVAALSACVETTGLNTGPSINLSTPVPVALLVPNSSGNASVVAQSLENAARLAVKDLGDVKIDLRVYDTGGSAGLAAKVAQQAVDDGAKVILGPLYAEAANTAAVAVADDGVNVLSFSNNPTIAGGNLFILGATFENTAERLVRFAASQGKRRAVIVHPMNVEGDLGRQAIEKAASSSAVSIVGVQGFEFSQQGVVNAIGNIKSTVENNNADMIVLTSNSSGALPLLAQMLPEAGLSPDVTQYVGLGRWDVPQQTLGLKGLQNGWFALPDQAMIANFSARYRAEYGATPHQLGGLAYDGIAAIGALVKSGNSGALTSAALTQSAGFEGVGGIFRLTTNGKNQRGLAIAQVQNKQVVIIDPAPRSFGGLNF